MKVACILGIGCAVGTASAEVQWNGQLTLTSDYVWRGSSQTVGEPALQAGARVTGARGFYAAVWASNVDLSPSQLKRGYEVDYTLGWAVTRNDLQADVSVVNYRYPGQEGSTDWTEANAMLLWKDRYSAQIGYSPNAMASGQRGTYVQLGRKLALNDRLHIEGSLAHYRLAASPSYSHVSLSGVYRAVGSPLTLRATWHQSDRRANTRFAGQAGSRAEIALQVAF